jgi:hypothetical protein
MINHKGGLMKTIKREAYLAHALNFTEREQDLIAGFAQWLPPEIIDCHAHCNLPEHVRSVDKTAYDHVVSTFPSFSLDESRAWHARFHPGKKVRSLRFANAFSGIDHRQANRYLLENSLPGDRIALYGLPDDLHYTISALQKPRVSALKMYPAYFKPPAVWISEYFPGEILKTAQDLGLPIILHPPKIITGCLDQILQLLKDFPRLRVAIAHLGLTKVVVPGLEEAYRRLAECGRVFLDTALAPSAAVADLAIRTFGAERIMYGSDEPLNLIRSSAYLHPTKGQRLVTEYPYHWLDPDEYEEFRHLAEGQVHAHWQSLNAIRRAVENLPAHERDCAKKQIFQDNARSFYGF